MRGSGRVPLFDMGRFGEDTRRILQARQEVLGVMPDPISASARRPSVGASFLHLSILSL